MSISINNNMMSLKISNLYTKNTSGLYKSMYEVSSGQRINSAGDDPSGLAQADRLKARTSSLNQAESNLQNDNAFLQIAEGTLGEVAGLISNIRDKVVQLANDGSNTSSSERTNVANDIKKINTQIKDVIANTKFGGKAIFTASTDSWAKNNSGKGFRVQHGADAADFENLGSAQGLKQLLNANASEFANDLSKLKDTELYDKITVSSATGSKIATLITNLDTMYNNIVNAQTDIGNSERKLGYYSDLRTNERTALTELESNIRDTDQVKGMTEFMKYNVRTQAAQFMLAQAGQIPGSLVIQMLE